MAEPTRRARIVEEIYRRLRTIRQVDGFETDCGETAAIGEVAELGPDDPAQAIRLAIGDEEVRWQTAGKALLVTLPFSVRALSRAKTDPWTAIEAMVGDIKRAVEVGDPFTVGVPNVVFERGPVMTLEREPGSVTVGAGVTYRVAYKESWGAP
jgi:hypothetical protein